MDIEPNENALLIAFGHAASKAQEIEAILQETLMGVEVVNDARGRSFADIAKEIEKLPLGELKRRYLETIGNDISDPRFAEFFSDINKERIFLMHKFFQIFPIPRLAGNKDAATRLNEIDKLVDKGRAVFRTRSMGRSLALGLSPKNGASFLGS